MKKVKVTVAVILAILLSIVTVSAGTMGYHNPLIDPQQVTPYVKLNKNFKNLLLLGMDKTDYSISRGSIYHTDAILVLAVNFDEHKIDLISLPRDTLTYVPGIKGIYKLNAAINCGGGKTEEGFQKACEAASWLLGGIKIDYYCAVDMNAMVAIGDAIGGVDVKLEMSYKGQFGKYNVGWQHLNGKGIMDYLRARKNATKNANDLGRTARQRDMITAIIKKLANDTNCLVSAIATAQRMEDRFFTNMSIADVAAILPLALQTDFDAMGSYVISGKYRTALEDWNFTFTDQENRKAVIHNVYGVDVQELKYVSFAYTRWLMENGFKVARCISVANLLRDNIRTKDETSTNEAQRDVLAAFDLALERTKAAFDKAADSMSDSDAKLMVSEVELLRKQGNALYTLFEDIKKPVWSDWHYWYADRMINEVDVNFH